MSIVTAFASALSQHPAFSGISVGTVNPEVLSDGASSASVRVEEMAPLGTLRRGMLSIGVVCPRLDETLFHKLLEVARAFRPSLQGWRVVNMRLTTEKQTRTIDSYLHAVVRFEILYKER